MTKRLILPFFISFILVLIFTPIVKNLAVHFGFVAAPKKDRWHKKETAIFGGFAIYLAFMIPYLIYVSSNKISFGFLFAAAVIFILGLVDDAIGIKPYTKLIGQIIAACILLMFGITFRISPFPLLNLLATIFWVVAIINAFNLLDNMDGLCSGISFIAATTIFLYYSLNNNYFLGVLSVLIAGTTLGFLKYNFHPAKIFMGDSGSMFLGLSLATAAIIGSWQDVSNLLITIAAPVLLLGVPVFDTILVTYTRRKSGRPIYQGGKDHASHRLVILGMSERRAVLTLYLISLLCGSLVLFYRKTNLAISLILGLFALIILFFFGLFLSQAKVYSGKDLREEDLTRDKIKLSGMVYYKRRMVEVVVDLIIIGIAYISAFLLRFEGVISPRNLDLIITSLPAIFIIKLSMFFYFRLYTGIWKYVGLHDLISIFKAVTAGSLISVLFLLFIFRFQGYSRAVFVIDWLILLFLAAGVRLTFRLFREYFATLANSGRRILIFGAGDAGEKLLREIRHNKKFNYNPIGFVDDDIDKQNKRIHGISVLGTRKDIPPLIQKHKIDEIIVAISSLPESHYKEFFELCKKAGVESKRTREILS